MSDQTQNSEHVQKALGDRIRNLRRNKGLSQGVGMPMAYPQRGGFGTIQPFVIINSKNWAVQFFPVGTSGYFRWMPVPSPSLVLNSVFNLEVDRARMVDTTVSGTTESDSNYFLKLPDGGSHALAFVGTSTTLFETVDASGYRVQLQGVDSYGVATSAVVLDRHGNHYQTEVHWITDVELNDTF